MQRVIKAIATPVGLWLASRLCVLVGLAVLPALVQPSNFMGASGQAASGWNLVAAWDSGWYQQITLHGYDYADDGKQHSVAFFPLYPLAVRGVMAIAGLGFEQAGFLVSNVAFLIGVVAFHRYVARRYGLSAAFWATAALSFYPYSLFGSVVYTEGLLLMLIVLALSSFDAQRYGRAWLFGGLATATKIVAMPLVPAFLLVSWLERRPLGAWLAGVGAATGLVGFIAYCAYAFGDPLAFVHVQAAWRGPSEAVWKEWAKLLVFGPTALLKPEAPAFGLLAIFGGGYWLYRLRERLKPLDFWFGCFALGLIALSGPMSMARFALVVTPLATALGLSLAERPKWGPVVIGYFAVVLAGVSLAFAFKLWIA